MKKIEKCNKSYMEKTNLLWEKLCRKDFKWTQTMVKFPFPMEKIPLSIRKQRKLDTDVKEISWNRIRVEIKTQVVLITKKKSALQSSIAEEFPRWKNHGGRGPWGSWNSRECAEQHVEIDTQCIKRKTWFSPTCGNYIFSVLT